jgi:hypothetical protein
MFGCCPLTLPQSPFVAREEAVFDEVRSAVETLKAVARDFNPLCVDGPRAAGLFEVVTEGERVCAAMKALLARHVDETKVWRQGGHRDAAHWVADATGETVGAAARTLAARALEQLPDTAAAFRAGELSQTQAAEIASTAAADPGAEAVLLETAAVTSVKGLRDRCRQVRAGAEADDRVWARRLHEQRRAHEWTDPHGTYCLSARMAPDAGARFASPGRPTPSASSPTRDAPDAVNLGRPTPPTRSSPSRGKGRASRSRCTSPSTAPPWHAATPSRAIAARSPAWARRPSRPPAPSSTTPG